MTLLANAIDNFQSPTPLLLNFLIKFPKKTGLQLRFFGFAPFAVTGSIKTNAKCCQGSSCKDY